MNKNKLHNHKGYTYKELVAIINSKVENQFVYIDDVRIEKSSYDGLYGVSIEYTLFDRVTNKPLRVNAINYKNKSYQQIIHINFGYVIVQNIQDYLYKIYKVGKVSFSFSYDENRIIYDTFMFTRNRKVFN